MTSSKLIVFTDLDGTLLDHHTYSWTPAQEALTLIKELGFPLVLTSSKTLAELQALSDELQTKAPVIGENGAVVAVPAVERQEVQTHYFGTPYKQLIECAHALRENFDFKFSGFSDMSITEVMEHTGLSEKEAMAAKSRQASEPLLWQDTEAQLNRFKLELQRQGLMLTKGGRFHHIMSPVDKGMAVNWVREYYQELEPGTTWFSMGLGDSYNDISMLESVDYPVLVKNPSSRQPDISHIKHIYITEAIGPKGWNTAVIEIVKTILRQSELTGEDHG